MELVGFNPLDFFSPEQVKLMRTIKPKGITSSHRRSKFGRFIETMMNSNEKSEIHRIKKGKNED